MDALKVQFLVFVFLCFVVMLANVAADSSKYIDWTVVATRMIIRNQRKFGICL